MLETVREYGKKAVGEFAEAELLQFRPADYFIQFAAIATPQVFGSGEIEWAGHIAAEHDNFQSAMNFALDRQDVDRAISLICQPPTHEYQMQRLIVFDPQVLLALPGASGHAGAPRVLWEAADPANTVTISLDAKPTWGHISAGGSDRPGPNARTTRSRSSQGP